MNLGGMFSSEQEFYRELQQGDYYNISDIYGIFFDFKTQQLTHALNTLIQDEEWLVNQYRQTINEQIKMINKQKDQ